MGALAPAIEGMQVDIFNWIMKLAAGVIALNLFVTPSFATGEIHCVAADGRSGEIHMNVGRLPILNVLSAEVTAFGKTWSTSASAENPIVVGQAFEDRTRMAVDFTDLNVESVVISLRTVRAFTGDEYGEAGVLRIGGAVYPVVCET